MTRGQAREKRLKAWTWFIGISVMVLIVSAVEGHVVELNGVVWDVLRSALVAAMAVALLVLIVAFVRERRAPPEPEAT